VIERLYWMTASGQKRKPPLLTSSFRSAPTAAIRLMIFRRLISTEAVEKASTLSRPLPPAGHDSVVLSHTGL
jgi:hypothetical protein